MTDWPAILSRCADCGLGTITAGEWYMVNDDVWMQAWAGRLKPWHALPGQLKRGLVAVNSNAIEDAIAFIKQNDIGFAAFDPFKSCHLIPENANTEMDVVAAAFSTIAERTNCAIGLDHHIRKPSAGQTEVTSSDARGASALINKVRLSRVCNQMTPALAEQARIKEEDRISYFRVDRGKGNIAPPYKATWFKIISVLCDNGEETPTVVPWTFPGPFSNVTTDHIHRVRTAVANGKYRKNVQADDWVGKVVGDILDLDLDDEADLKQIKAILKTWFANGVLATAQGTDANHIKREFVVPGNWNEDAKQ
jgi:hypothetical protein